MRAFSVVKCQSMVATRLFRSSSQAATSFCIRSMLGINGDVAAATQRFDFQKNFRHAIAHILMVVDLTVARSRRERGVNFAHQLFVGFVHADQRELRIAGCLVTIKHIFHAHDKGGAAIGRDFPVFAQVRLKFAFFSARWTLMVETFGAILSSTAFSASSRTVQRTRPAGSVKGEFWRLDRRFAHQGSFNPFLHESLLEMLDGAGSDAQCLGDVGDFPRVAKLSGIAQQQCPRMNELCGGCLAVARQLFELAALLLRESDSISGCFHPPIFHYGHPLVNMRNIMCYKILGFPTEKATPF